MPRLFLAVLLLASCATLRADFTYGQTVQMTGGALFDMLKALGPFSRQAREPMATTIVVKGNRMANIGKDHVQVIDLDKETITEIDLAKKQYSVMTFAQMKQAMDDAVNRLQNQKAQKSAASAPNNAPNIETSFNVSAKSTGKTKTLSGLDAKETIITMTLQGTDTDTGQSGSMAIADDAWMASVPGYDEVQAFHKKMGEKMGYAFGSGMAQMGMMRPETLKGFAAVSKQMANADGVPVETVMKMGGPGTGTDACAAAESQQSQQSDSQSAGAAATSAALGRLGLGGFGRKKNKDSQTSGSQTQSQSGAASSDCLLLMEMTTQLTGFSAGPADTSKFDVPAGFKQVENDLVKRSVR
jgi:hypothetical protein